MPPPRLPRHLRPCRPLWSARQVRFASDSASNAPSTADGDSSQSSRDGRWTREQQRAAQTAGSTESVTPSSHARRMRKTPSGGPARDATRPPKAQRPAPQLRIHRYASAAPPTQTEDELRQRLQKLKGRLAMLQAKLASASAATTRPRPPASDAPAHTADDASGTPREQSLLDELFPEASSLVAPAAPDRRPAPPKLDLPAPDSNPHIRLTLSDARSDRERAIDSFRARGEQTTVLQLSHCSTALTEADFRRLLPRGLHIDAWSSAGHFYKLIPARDPLSLARLPFYYLLFHSPAAALAYQKNAARLSRLAALHAPSSVASAVAPPAGFLEDGEDLAAVTSSFVLHPRGHALDLRMVMQPYNRALRALIDAGGYTPVVPNTDDKGRKIHRVLLHIDGYEPSHWDLWQILSRHAHARGIIWPFRNDHASAVRRLRDAINLRTVGRQKLQATASSNPRASASGPASHASSSADGDGLDYEDANISSFLGPMLATGTGDGNSAREINQLVMNRVYNRWIVELDDEDAARRFASLWHRVLLPEAKDKKGAWRETEEERWVEAEYLW